MVSRYYRTASRRALATADDESSLVASSNWSTAGRAVDDGRGEPAQAAAGPWRARSRARRAPHGHQVPRDRAKLELDSADMRRAGRPGRRPDAALAATQTRNSIQLSGAMNQLPTKPRGSAAGQQPTPEQETAMGQYNAGWPRPGRTSRCTRTWRGRHSRRWTPSTPPGEVMKEIHGEPDPVEPPTTPVPGGGGGAPPAIPGSPPGTPGTSRPARST